MKILTTISISIVLFVLSFNASAQKTTEIALSKQQISKPKLFKGLPERVHVDFKEIDDAFNYETGKSVMLKMSSDFIVAGHIISKAEDAAAGVKTIVVRDANRPGATLSLSRYINQNNTLSYRGMFMSFKHADAYEVVSENGEYFLIKKDANILYEE